MLIEMNKLEIIIQPGIDQNNHLSMMLSMMRNKGKQEQEYLVRILISRRMVFCNMKMRWRNYFVFLFTLVTLSSAKQVHEITVMSSQAKPYVFHENGSLKGMEVDIITNFAQKFHLKVNLVEVNESLKDIFSTHMMGKFLQSIEHL